MHQDQIKNYKAVSHTIDMSSYLSYLDILRRIVQYLHPCNYLEIGVRHGVSFAMHLGNIKSIGIDPEPDIKHKIKSIDRIYPMTSNEFFEKHDIKEILNNTVQFCFIDGFRLFEQFLADFINVEKNSDSMSVVIITATIPLDEETSARERTTDFWTSDVWKLVLCLKKYRPDLKTIHLDTAVTGIFIITNLNPTSTVLSEQYDAIVNEYKDISYSDIAADKNAKLGVESYSMNKIKSFLSASRRKRSITEALRSLNNYTNNKKWFPCIYSKTGANDKRAPRCLAPLLCYNDADILEENILYLTSQNHDIIAWDHGSTDDTAKILDKYNDILLERRFLPREFDFYKLYETMAEHLIQNWISKYDWISWPDQDEFLEGPFRNKSYYEYITDVFNAGYDWIQFDNFNYWFTDKDDSSILSPIKRVRHYSLFPSCAPRITSWRASHTNVDRKFGHGPISGKKFPIHFVMRHYPIRSEAQMIRRLEKDRVNIARNGQNIHYEGMQSKGIDRLRIPSNALNFDDLKTNLNRKKIFDYSKIYF